jgi:hypothetical protein
MKTKEEVDKELEDWLTEPKREDDLLRHYVKSIQYKTSLIRKDDIDGLVEWAEKERNEYILGAMNGKIKKMIPYDAAFINIIAHLQALKEKV